MSPVLTLAVALLLQDPAPAPAAADPATAVPDAPAPEVPAADLYQPPRIRPFEPPADFAPPPELVVPAAATNRPLDRVVTVDAYAGDYEAADTAIEIAYDQGVAAAERRVESAMGPLDGLWRVVDRDGRVHLLLSIVDPGGEAPVQGGWLVPGAAPAADDGVLTGEVQRPDGARLVTGAGTLRLTLRGGVWRGVLAADGRDIPVSLQR
jgi:hypothetical protein